MTDLGSLCSYLGIEFKVSPKFPCLKDMLLTYWNVQMVYFNLTKTPMETHLKLS